MSPLDAHRTVDAIWRIESPKLIAGLTRMVRDIGVAEELARADRSWRYRLAEPANSFLARRARRETNYPRLGESSFGLKSQQGSLRYIYQRNRPHLCGWQRREAGSNSANT